MPNQTTPKSADKASNSSTRTTSGPATPHLESHSVETQKFGTRIRIPIGLKDGICEKSATALNQVLADTITLRDLYKKSHWQTSGATFYQLHLLFDKHYEEQAKLVDEVAERIQILGGISVAMAADVAEMTSIERPPKGREDVHVQLTRLLNAHEQILIESRRFAKEASENEDDGTNDLLISDVVRTNEMQTWFLAEHLVAISESQASSQGNIQ